MPHDPKETIVEVSERAIYGSKYNSGEYLGKVKIATHDGPSVDAFGRFRTSNAVTLFDSKLLEADDSPLFWDEVLESGANITASTPTAAKPYIDFTSTINTAGVFTRQTFQRFNYQPGKFHLIMMTAVLDLSGGGTGVTRRAGYFDDNNGVFFEFAANGDMHTVIRSNVTGTPVDTAKHQEEWNLDHLDGHASYHNPSGRTAEPFIVVAKVVLTPRCRTHILTTELPRHLKRSHFKFPDQRIYFQPIILCEHIAARCLSVETGYIIEVVYVEHTSSTEEEKLPNHGRRHIIQITAVENLQEKKIHFTEPLLDRAKLHQVTVKCTQGEPGSRGGHNAGEHPCCSNLMRLTAYAVNDTLVAPPTFVSVCNEETPAPRLNELLQLFPMRDKTFTLKLHGA